ncbi:hypothetical protein B0T17DRAFT_519217 [Bombardia bombarda]|uniref:Uncharacterized protein n=1 Tax=Bombardia bombarda TaxID=252184 RepID=A0AA39XM61_9PEZI|nr:hypothetical protein B0T17DRAFT_519217 [Bombardia bombarda]
MFSPSRVLAGNCSARPIEEEEEEGQEYPHSWASTPTYRPLLSATSSPFVASHQDKQHLNNLDYEADEHEQVSHLINLFPSPPCSPPCSPSRSPSRTVSYVPLYKLSTSSHGSNKNNHHLHHLTSCPPPTPTPIPTPRSASRLHLAKSVSTTTSLPASPPYPPPNRDLPPIPVPAIQPDNKPEGGAAQYWEVASRDTPHTAHPKKQRYQQQRRDIPPRTESQHGTSSSRRSEGPLGDGGGGEPSLATTPWAAARAAASESGVSEGQGRREGTHMCGSTSVAQSRFYRIVTRAAVDDEH